MRLVDRLRDGADPSFRAFFIQATVAGCLTLLAFPAAILLGDVIRPGWPPHARPLVHLERTHDKDCASGGENAQPRMDGETSTGRMTDPPRCAKQ